MGTIFQPSLKKNAGRGGKGNEYVKAIVDDARLQQSTGGQRGFVLGLSYLAARQTAHQKNPTKGPQKGYLNTHTNKGAMAREFGKAKQVVCALWGPTYLLLSECKAWVRREA
jgi:hypothetical protein